MPIAVKRLSHCLVAGTTNTKLGTRFLRVTNDTITEKFCMTTAALQLQLTDVMEAAESTFERFSYTVTGTDTVTGTGILSEVGSSCKNRTIKSKPKPKQKRTNCADTASHFTDSTKKSKRIQKTAERHKRKKLAVEQPVPTLLSPTTAQRQLRQARLHHPLTFFEKPIKEQFRGYLHFKSSSLWKRASDVPTEMTKDDVFELHDLKDQLPPDEFGEDHEIFYISSSDGEGNGSGTVVIDDDSGVDDSSIVELAVSVSHVSDSEFFDGDILVTDINGTVVEPDINLSDINEDGFLDSGSEVDPMDNLSMATVPESPLPTNEPIEIERPAVSADYTRMKIAELRQIAKSKGLKTGRTKDSVIDVLIRHDLAATAAPDDLEPPLTNNDLEYELTETLRTTNIAKPWWEMMLTYDPIPIEDFFTFVRTQLMIPISLNELKNYLDAQGICFKAKEDSWNRK